MKQSDRLYTYFIGLCRKRLCNYISRESRSSKYIEVVLERKTYLFRFSDHEPTATIPWEPDFDIRDNKTFSAAKKFLKSKQRSV